MWALLSPPAAAQSSPPQPAPADAKAAATAPTPEPTTTSPLRRPVPPGFQAGKSTEIVAERNETTKFFRNPDGSKSAQMSNVPVHYKDAGAWADIDSREERPWSTPRPGVGSALPRGRRQGEGGHHR